MTDQNLHVAMANEIYIGPYDPPRLNPESRSCEWLIIRRWGDKSQFLEIADAGGIPKCDIPDKAPDGVRANNSMLGLMVRKISDTDAVYLLVRTNPLNQTLAGKFFPVDGYAELSCAEGQWSLRASGRHAHDKDGGDMPYPPKGGGMSWHFDAKQVPWTHEET